MGLLCSRFSLRKVQGCREDWQQCGWVPTLEGRAGADGTLPSPPREAFLRKDVHYTVQMGAPWLNRKADTISEVAVTQVIVNSRFRAQRYWSWIGRANDIGLLKLQRAFMYSKYIWPICLPGTDFAVKEQRVCTVTGWGLSSDNSESVPPPHPTLLLLQGLVHGRAFL